MKSSVNKLESKFLAYPENIQRRLLSELITNFLPGTSPSGHEVLEQIARWLKKGIDAPTARQSGDGWHKQFEKFVVEGEGGSIYIQRITRLHGMKRQPRGVDLDDHSWKSVLNKPEIPRP